MAQNTFNTGNPFLDYLEESTGGKRALFFGSAQQALGGLPTTERKRAALENVFQNVQNEFLAELGSQALSGQAPSLSFTQFLGEKPTSQTGERRATLPYTERIMAQMGRPMTSYLTPRTRYLMNF